ncbi:hypothetical protein [Microbacterium dextranolyticum]|nr:hypothetical protein [Microbacterium dextranolyticum]MBM7463773.1 hypothetical protein [Microbacterium dextranolyticum]
MRSVLSGLGVAFTAYLAAAALLWTSPPAYWLLQVTAVAFYLVTTWVCIFWQVHPVERPESAMRPLGERSLLPGWAAVLALAVAAIVPSASWVAAGESARLANYATWSLGAVGALMAIVMVRRRPWVAWSGVALAALAAAAWIGMPAALARGVVGAILWVGLAQLISWLVDRAAHDTARLEELQREASQWLASQEGVRRERRTQIQRALAVAGPVLARTIETAGRLDDAERHLAGIAEGTLRDELRGAGLLDDEVRRALSAARERGASVSVLDEGGLDVLSSEERAMLRAELARLISESVSQRLYIRAARHDEIAVTVVGRSAQGEGEDIVDLWHEFRRPADD